MKPEELQIFDWVSYKGNPIMVFEIDEPEHNINTEQDGYNAIRCISIDEIQPIPITPTILEKNGFEYMYDEYGCWMYKKFELIEREPYNGLFEAEVKIAGTYKFINYVHQLQQLLRLVGIKKEIEL